MMTQALQFFLYGDTPVKFERTPSGGLRVWVFDPETRGFFADSTYRSRVLYDRDNLTRAVNEAEFTREVERLGGLQAV
ncbi:hypothetical protein [Deinococcus sp. QL22]|uniref:hypothetical protein n=1 Tax=Deinococcus sp. QL22 TaxID=2939437 RepID=UPI0020182D37|nr:hypothetical protein [Deinococcus sp. QL22]UQN10235.1 hypothetical protein M1R55_28060 [Deinococcus sp. QL22]